MKLWGRHVYAITSDDLKDGMLRVIAAGTSYSEAIAAAIYKYDSASKDDARHERHSRHLRGYPIDGTRDQKWKWIRRRTRCRLALCEMSFTCFCDTSPAAAATPAAPA